MVVQIRFLATPHFPESLAAHRVSYPPNLMFTTPLRRQVGYEILSPLAHFCFETLVFRPICLNKYLTNSWKR
jgi:hypothetical protein